MNGYVMLFFLYSVIQASHEPTRKLSKEYIFNKIEGDHETKEKRMAFMSPYFHRDNVDTSFSQNFTLQHGDILHITSKTEMQVEHDAKNHRVNIILK
jgi:hypothetical protein